MNIKKDVLMRIVRGILFLLALVIFPRCLLEIYNRKDGDLKKATNRGVEFKQLDFQLNSKSQFKEDESKKKTTSAYRCDDEFKNLDFQLNSRSQFKEDEILMNSFFKGICGGAYVELGALDGVRFSNSHLFGKGLQWRGILIEPNPKSFELLQGNRPNDELFNNAICSEKKNVHFVDDSDAAVTGVYEFMHPSFIERWHKNVIVKNLRKIICRPLHAVIAESTLKDQIIDFLSLDVEGGEFEVVKTINFEEDQFGLIFYEADLHNPLKNEAMKTYLEKKGYAFRFHQSGSNFHVNQNWDELYGDLIQ